MRELWRTCNEAYVTIAEAIEEAGRLGIPVEIIAREASVPVGEVEAILKEARDGDP